MKIHADFLDARPRLARPLAAGLWGAALAAALAAAWLAADALQMRDERPQLEARLARLAAQAAAAPRAASAPPAHELGALRERVQTLNKLAGVRGWSTPQLLDWLGARLPESVHLVSLQHRPREGEALLVAESASAEALTGFLLRLESERRLDEVLLSKQGTVGNAGATAVQFEIRIRWKS
jgi:hypothetical protein